jgi:hypothetical protein
MKYLVLITFMLISFGSYGQKKYKELQEVESEVVVPKNAFLIINKCPFDIHFKITKPSKNKTYESLNHEESSLFWIEVSCKVTIIREKNKPSNGDTYKVLERRKYAFIYDSDTDFITLIEYVQ